MEIDPLTAKAAAAGRTKRGRAQAEEAMLERMDPAANLAARDDPAAYVFARARSERGYRRRDAILEAATAEFLAKGFQGASLRSIIAASGGSSETLYRQFQNKEGLFQAVVAHQLMRGYENYLTTGLGDGPLEAELTAFGIAYTRAFTDSNHLALYRITISESANMPALSRAIWEHGRVGVEANLEAYLRRQAAAGLVRVSSPLLAARQFMEMAKGSLHLHKLCGGVDVSEAEIAENVHVAVEIFARGVAVAPKLG